MVFIKNSEHMGNLYLVPFLVFHSINGTANLTTDGSNSKKTKCVTYFWKKCVRKRNLAICWTVSAFFSFPLYFEPYISKKQICYIKNTKAKPNLLICHVSSVLPLTSNYMRKYRDNRLSRFSLKPQKTKEGFFQGYLLSMG